MKRMFLGLLLLSLAAGVATAQPSPGDLILSDLSRYDNLTWLDRTTGKLTTFAASVTPAYYNWVTIDANNTDLAASISNASSSVPSYLVSVTPAGKVTTIVMAIPAGRSGTMNGIDFDQAGDYILTSSDNYLKRVSGGKITSLLKTPSTVNNLAWNQDNGKIVIGIFSAGLLLQCNGTTGQIESTIATGLGSFSSIDPEPATGNFVITSFSTPQVRIIAPTGTVVTTWSFSGANGCKVEDPTGHILVTGLGTIGEYDNKGTRIKTWGPFSGYSFTAVDVYGSRTVYGSGTAVPGTPYSVQFSFPGQGNSQYVGALALSQRPGINLAGSTVNLALDPLLILSLTALPGSVLLNFQGTLNTQGQAKGTINIPSGLPKGLTFFCSAIVLSGSTIITGNTIGITTR